MFKINQVLCSNCGFLCWYMQHYSGEGPYRFVELSRRARNDFQAGTFDGTEYNQETDEDCHIFCLRRQWVLIPGNKSKPDYVDADDLRKLRKCAYYVDYQPAFGPEEHKELKREAETRQTIFKATLIGAAIGASAAIVVQLLYLIFA